MICIINRQLRTLQYVVIFFFSIEWNQNVQEIVQTQLCVKRVELQCFYSSSDVCILCMFCVIDVCTCCVFACLCACGIILCRAHVQRSRVLCSRTFRMCAGVRARRVLCSASACALYGTSSCVCVLACVCVGLCVCVWVFRACVHARARAFP